MHLEPDDVQAWLGSSTTPASRSAPASASPTTPTSPARPDDPNAAVIAAYTWLTYLEGELVETLLGDLPD